MKKYKGYADNNFSSNYLYAIRLIQIPPQTITYCCKIKKALAFLGFQSFFSKKHLFIKIIQ